MELVIGSKIRELRRRKDISQEVLAQYLGVSFQAVSKWESGITMPDIGLIPAIASFFGISIDELFDYNSFEIEKRVQEIVAESYPYRFVDDGKCEEILREGLKKYPGNETLLNCLIYSIPTPERGEEVIIICKSLIEGAKDDATRYDACRILAETYKKMGEEGLARNAIEQIPEFYFTRLELEAEMLAGEDKFRAADIQKNLSADSLLNMLEKMADCYHERGETEKEKMQLEIAVKVAEAFKEDYLTERMCRTVYQDRKEWMEKIKEKLLIGNQ